MKLHSNSVKHLSKISYQPQAYYQPQYGAPLPVGYSQQQHHSQATIITWDTLNNLSGVRCGLDFFFLINQ